MHWNKHIDMRMPAKSTFSYLRQVGTKSVVGKKFQSHQGFQLHPHRNRMQCIPSYIRDVLRTIESIPNHNGIYTTKTSAKRKKMMDPISILHTQNVCVIYTAQRQKLMFNTGCVNPMHFDITRDMKIHISILSNPIHLNFSFHINPDCPILHTG